MDYRTLPWPKNGDKLFSTQTDGSESMIAGVSVSFGSFADSFRDAANLLVTHLDSHESYERDRLIFPVIYLYRHHVELMLKAIIERGDELYQTQRLRECMHHRLLDLWRVAKELIVGNKLSTIQETEAVEDIIREFADADPLSFSFRYPVDKDLNKLPPQWHKVSVTNLQNTTAKLSNFLKDALYTLYQAGDGA
jgi:hypothetical protein